MKNPFTLKSSKSKSLNGIIYVPTDKSISIRALIISSLCLGNSKIFDLLESEDVKNTMKSLKKLGIKIIKKKKYYEIYGNGGVFEEPSDSLYLGNSGTGVRLLTGLLSSRGIKIILTGDKSLSSRPMKRIIEPLELMNLTVEHNKGCLPLIIKNNKKKIPLPIKYDLNIGSAQIKSAILLASTNIKGTTTIIEKFPSRNHTEIMLKFFGADIKINKRKITISSPNFLKPKALKVPGDFSSAAFLIVATLITKNSSLIIKDVGLNFYRTGLIDILKKMNAKISLKNKHMTNGEWIGDIHVSSSRLISTSVNKTIIPRLIDELPILFVAASFAKGTSKFTGLEELKFKESDRLNSMAIALKDSGVIIKQKSTSLMISGGSSQPGGSIIKTFNDHRIAMSMLVFGLASENKIIIDDEKMIKTSFPNFKEIFNSVGAKIEFLPK
jgi:3-phosphoshikimate 1-carboxyvinyltransferase